MTGGRDTISLSSDELEVSLLPGKGCDIVSLVDRRSGVDVMFRSPWGRRDAAGWGAAGTSSIERWVEAYPGGWQVLLPNGGDECIEGGVTWGYHGEAALARWSVLDSGPSRAVLETRLFTVPLHLRREILVAGRVVRLEERVSNESEQDLEVMWGHHPAFGAPFLEGGCLISAGCESVLADPDAPGTILAPRSRHRWPHARTAAGEPIDLSVVPGPGEKRAVLAYLGDFSDGFFALTNPRLQLGVGMRWPREVFPYAWLWQEVHSGEEWPWYRRAYVVAIEPASTIPGHGMTRARAEGYAGVRLAAGSSRAVVLEAVLFDAAGPVAGIDEGGAVRFA